MKRSVIHRLLHVLEILTYTTGIRRASLNVYQTLLLEVKPPYAMSVGWSVGLSVIISKQILKGLEV